nr:methyl-accepting chemotaxis protein [uncultured Roseateles sp.]
MQMKSLGAHGVAFRLWCSVALLALALLASTGFAAWRGARLQQAADTTTATADNKLDAAQRWVNLTTANVVRIEAGAASTDPAVAALFKDEITAVTAEVNRVKQAIDAMPLTDADQALMAAVADKRGVMLAALARLRGLKAEETPVTRQALVQGFKQTADLYLRALGDFAAEQQRARTATLAALAEEREETAQLAGWLMAAIVAGLALGAVLLVRSIQRPLAEAIAVAGRIADGDLATPVAPPTRRDEFGLLLQSMAGMAERLRGVVGNVRQGVDALSTASAEIAAGNQDLSHRTEQAAASLEETASAMDELSATVAQSADNAQQARQLADAAAQAATRGAAVVGQVVHSMGDINDSSLKIQSIVGLIDQLAFQTNILALNAAVEAARAGEQGRGFAVVAAEVRSLAQRSAGAAREIKSLIGTSVDRVDAGTALAAQAGGAMQDIVAGINGVVTLIAEIATAAAEQRDGISQVHGAVNQLDQMTQQNAALVEQSAAATQSLRDQAHRLSGVAGQFRLG